jgi:hypothetical protein
MTEKNRLIDVWVNPLQFLEVDEPWAGLTNAELSPERVLDFLCTPGAGSDLATLVERYRAISQEPKRIFAAPIEPRILNKLIWPLRHAKASYMVGNYLGTISLCGMVAEMVAILLFEISEIRLNNAAMTVDDEKALFGSAFERLSQERRAEILRGYGLIDSEIKSAFDLIRTKRRRYLHLWSQDHDALPADAVATYNAAIALVIRAIGQDIDEGKLVLNPELVKYLERQGVYEPAGENEGGDSSP